MRINIYAEELPDDNDTGDLREASRLGFRHLAPALERVEKIADTGRTFFGARIYLKSPKSLHHTQGDDDRSAITFWGPRAKVAMLLRQLADTMEQP